MITDEVIEAIDKMIGLCKNVGDARRMGALRDMLAEFDVELWLNMTSDEQIQWLGTFM